ncbi:unnamed protein product [Moneuplotes crassus]|uniref:Uncharacterized protein n=1 Tax=Euplotes crassus TaxID=5936 RepID=A0AAD1UHV4_EUPCR|nr:unnamed protein product [Moneuplotes crassus]
MSVYNGFGTRCQETAYNKATYNMLFLLQHMVYCTLTSPSHVPSEGIPEEKFGKHFEKIYTKMSALETHKYQPPKYSAALKDLREYFSVEELSSGLKERRTTVGYLRNKTPVTRLEPNNRDLCLDEEEAAKYELLKDFGDQELFKKVSNMKNINFQRKYNLANCDSIGLVLKDRLTQNKSKKDCTTNNGNETFKGISIDQFQNSVQKFRSIRRPNPEDYTARSKSKKGCRSKDLQTIQNESIDVQNTIIPNKLITFVKKTSKSNKEIKIQRKKNRILAQSIHSGCVQKYQTNFTITNHADEIANPQIHLKAPMTAKGQRHSNNSVGNISRRDIGGKNLLFKAPMTASNICNTNRLEKGKFPKEPIQRTLTQTYQEEEDNLNVP